MLFCGWPGWQRRSCFGLDFDALIDSFIVIWWLSVMRSQAATTITSAK